MPEYEEIKDVLSESSEDCEDGTLLGHVFPHQKSASSSSRHAYLLFLHFSNVVLLACTVLLSIRLYVLDHQNHDPSLGVYCKQSDSYLLNTLPDMFVWHRPTTQ